MPKTKVMLESHHGAWLLIPLNKKIAKAVKKHTRKESLLFQCDYDYPALAINLGWKGAILSKPETEITQAGEWLGEHDGDTFMIYAEVFEQYM